MLIVADLFKVRVIRYLFYKLREIFVNFVFDLQITKLCILSLSYLLHFHAQFV